MVLARTPVCSTIHEDRTELTLIQSAGAPRSHRITITPAATLPGNVIIRFEGRGLPVTTNSGRHGYLSDTGCPTSEITAFLALLERTHNVRLIVDRQAAGI